ncbi:MAG: heme-binding protein [Roseobacter sp.]
MSISEQIIQGMVANGRVISEAQAGEEVLGPLRLLPGIWKNTDDLHGFGFNMIALPFAPNEDAGYRLLMNQYDEELHFSIVDKGVPNRGSGFDPATQSAVEADQTIVALDYDQRIIQIAAEDFPASGKTDIFQGQAIHKEPGLWLHMTDQNTNGINIARLGTVPHGNSLLTLGRAQNDPVAGLPPNVIPNVNGVVVGGGTDPNEDDFVPPYFDPYKHFHENPFKGSVDIPGFDGFEPVDMTALLRHALATKLPGEVKRTMRLHVDSTLDHAGIVNIPFVVRQADATAMNATFLIYEVEDSETGRLRYFMQYVQNVILDFIGRPDGHPGRARWPHVSINTMERVSDADAQSVKMRMLTD